jgi:hypothetical protein
MEQDQREIQALFQTRVAPLFESKVDELNKLGEKEVTGCFEKSDNVKSFHECFTKTQTFQLGIKLGLYGEFFQVKVSECLQNKGGKKCVSLAQTLADDLAKNL